MKLTPVHLVIAAILIAGILYFILRRKEDPAQVLSAVSPGNGNTGFVPVATPDPAPPVVVVPATPVTPVAPVVPANPVAPITPVTPVAPVLSGSTGNVGNSVPVVSVGLPTPVNNTPLVSVFPKSSATGISTSGGWVGNGINAVNGKSLTSLLQF